MRLPFSVCCLIVLAPLAARASAIRIEERPFADHEHLLVVGASPRMMVSAEGGKLLLDDPAGTLRLAGTIPRARYVRSMSVEGRHLVLMLDAEVSAKTRLEKRGIAIDLTMRARAEGIVPASLHQPALAGTKPQTFPNKIASSERVLELPAPFLASVEGAVAKVLSKPSVSEFATDRKVDRADGPIAPVGTSRSATSDPPDVLRLPFSRSSGVAARQRGDDLLLIFDQERMVDMTVFTRNKLISKGSGIAVDGASELLLRFKSQPAYELIRDDDGWSLRLGSDGKPSGPITLRQENSSAVLFDVRRAGRSVVVRDPETGQLLLVGTITVPGQSVEAGRKSALFSVDQTDAGIVVESSSDHVLLRPVESGFALETDDGSSLHVPADFAGKRHLADHFRRTLHLPSGSVSELSRRLRAAMISAAAIPIRDRLDARLACVETLLSLGLGREAETLLKVALADAPTAAADERVRLIQTVIGVIDPGAVSIEPRPAREADTNEADDSVLWGALADRSTDEAGRQRDADRVRGDLNLFLGYPPLLGRAVSERVAEVLLAGGTSDDLRTISKVTGSGRADIVKALADDRLGRPAKALKELVALERSADHVQVAEAARRQIEIRFRNGTLSPRAAADLLAAYRLDWRLAGDEGPVLLEEARLRLRDREFKQGVVLLRQAEQAEPALHDEVSGAMGGGIARLADPHDAAVISDADFVSISDQYADVIRSDPALSVKVATIRAEKLARLGLPGSAAASIESVLSAQPSGPERAALELRAAELHFQQGDTLATTLSLRAADADQVPPQLATRRALVAARLFAKTGHPQEALAALGDGTDPAMLDVKAGLLADTGDWKASEGALAPLVTALPAKGLLSAHDEDLVLRFATSAFRAGDKEELRGLERREAGRLTEEADRVALARFAQLDDAITKDLPSPVPGFGAVPK